MNGKYHYFALRAGNHQEIARSNYYEEEAGMLAAFNTIRQMFSPQPKAPVATQDDYLACEAYAGEVGFHRFTHDDNGEHYFAFNRVEDGKTLLRSEGYASEASRDKGIQSVIKNAPIEKRWSTATALDDKYHYYILKAGNHREIARSCYYEDQALMLADLEWIKSEDSPIGFGSAIVGGTLLSAAMLKLKEQEGDASKTVQGLHNY